MKKQVGIALGAVIIILIALLAYQVFKTDSQPDINPLSDDSQTILENILVNSPPQTQNNQALPPTTPTSPPADPTENWQTYTNSSLGFSIKYPSNATPSLELNDEHNRMTAFGQISGRYFEVRLHDDTDPDMGVKYGFLGAEITSTNTTVAGIRGFRAVSEAGYGDAGVQGSPYVNFGVRKNNLVYHVLFYGDANISAEEQAILQTFKLLN